MVNTCDSDFCHITKLTKKIQEETAFWAHCFALGCRMKLGKCHDKETEKVNAWIDDTVIPALKEKGNGVIQQAVKYFSYRSYGRKHLLYLWHLSQEEKERATQHPFVTDEVFQILMRGDLKELVISYQEVMDKYGL